MLTLSFFLVTAVLIAMAASAAVVIALGALGTTPLTTSYSILISVPRIFRNGALRLSLPGILVLALLDVNNCLRILGISPVFSPRN